MRTTRTLGIILCCSAGLLAQNSATPSNGREHAATVDGRDLLLRSIATAERSWKAREHYTYTQRDEEKRLDSKGHVKSQDVDVSKVIFVNGAAFEQLVEHNGGAPTAEDQRKQQEKMRKLQTETPAERADRLSKEKENRAFLREVPDAFDFKVVAEDEVNGRPAYVLACTPRPAFRSRTKYGRMFSKVRGKVWVDKQDLGWVKVDAQVIEPFSMGLFIARVLPGSHIFMEQTRVADGVWLPKKIQIKAEAKILFVKTYDTDEVVTYWDYRPTQATSMASNRPPSGSPLK
jgi:hypothetical protein